MEREEALKEIKMWGIEAPRQREVLETLIPELRESEDERIRKALIDFFQKKAEKGFEWVEYGIPNNAVLAYLEKQKDKMTAEEFESSGLFQLKLKTKYANGYQDGLAQKEQKPDDPLDDPKFLKGFDTGREVQRIFDEKKPNVEICPHSIKSKSYSVTGYPIEDCDYGLEIALDILEKTLGKVQGFQTDDGIREHQTAIKAVKDAMEEQELAEWSEEDEMMLCSIIETLKYTNGAANMKIDWLKSLRPQPKQEWSEEDERNYEYLHQVICCYINNPQIEYKERERASKKLIPFWERLKSLRPSWKPSEEQMDALESARLMYAHGLEREDIAVVLESLYEQLKSIQ